MVDKVLFVFDAQAVGAHGESFAVGFVAFNRDTEIILKSGYYACKPEAAAGNQTDLLWIQENIAPWLPEPNVELPVHVREKFWKMYKAVTENPDWEVSIWVDCGFPAEGSFLRDCIVETQYYAPTMSFWADYGSKDFTEQPSKPKPLNEIATVRTALGLDPLPIYDLPQEKRFNPLDRALYITPLLHSWLESISTLTPAG